MFGKILHCVVLTFVCAVFGFGQQNKVSKEKVEKPCEPSQILGEQIRQGQKNPEIEFRGISGSGNWLGKFIPPGTDAWGVKIVTTGGFSGNGLATVKVFSDGEVVIDNDHPGSSRIGEVGQLSSNVLQKISQIVLSQTLTENTKNVVETNESAQKETPFLCNDCYQTTITIVRREANGEIRYFSNREKNLLFSTGDFNRIHQTIMKNTGITN